MLGRVCRSACRRWRTPWGRDAWRWIRYGGSSRPMFWRLSACTVMTPRCRSWPKARPIPADAGSMSEMTCHSAERRRRPRCSITPATAKASIRSAIWPTIPDCSRPTRLTDIANFMSLTEVRVRSSKQGVGSTPGGRSLPWRISRRTRDDRRRARRLSCSLPLQLRWCDALMGCSTSSGPSMVNLPTSAELFARNSASRWSRRSRSICASNAPNSPEVTTSPRPSIISSSVGRPSPCSLMTGVCVYRTTPPSAPCVASRWAACCCDVQPHRHSQDERRRSAGLARRRPGPDRHVSGPSAQRITAVELEASGVQRSCRGSLNMPPVNKVHHVRTIAIVAEMLGENEDWLCDVANEMDQDDGLIWVYGPGDDGVMAFTDDGIENLKDLVQIHKDDPSILTEQQRALNAFQKPTHDK